MPTKKQKPSGLLDAVMEVESQRYRRPTWLDRIPEKERAELMEVRRKVLAGEIRATKKAVAKSIVQWSIDNGFPVTASEITIAQWLREKP